MAKFFYDFRNWVTGHEIGQEEIRAEEQGALDRRRAALGLDPGAAPIGLALSGGGIRSATFGLGLLRELAAQRLLHRFDYLSTVSGGSYIGAYYVGLFAPRQTDGGVCAPVLDGAAFAAGADPFGRPAGPALSSLDWLRQSGRYLAPQGAGDYWKAVGLLARNWLGLQLVIGTSIMLVALFAVGFRLLAFELPWIRHDIVLPTLLVHAPLLVLLAFPVTLHIAVGWAFWLTRRDLNGWTAGTNVAQLGTIAILVVAGAVAGYDPLASLFSTDTRRVQIAAGAIAVFALLGLVALGLSHIFAGKGVSAEESWDHRRAWLTGPMSLCAGLIAAVLVTAAADAFAFWISRQGVAGRWAGISASAAAVLVPAARSLVSRLMQMAGSVPRNAAATASPGLLRKEVLSKLGAALVAILLLLAVITFWWVFAYKAAWPVLGARLPACAPDLVAGTAWPGCPALSGWRPAAAWGAWLGVIGFLAVCIARTTTFINLSGLTSFYAGRLRRAYLGAGNRARLDQVECSENMIALDKWDERDDVILADYYSNARDEPDREPSAAPLHLINITLNETRGTGSNIVQRDRRGRNLALSPAGLYCNSDRSGRLYRIGYAENEHEALPLSSWVAISGAAFSTGLGARTGFPMSQLAGLANVRLGYWWRANIGRVASITQWDLLREFRGDFSGPSKKYWYLSDGGHFENTGAYELIRRRLPFIVISDNGMDERFEYEDIANLVRKARIDFDCEIEFLSDGQLDVTFTLNPTLRKSFGTLRDIAGKGDPANTHAVAALARLSYDTEAAAAATVGTLLLIKPRFTGDGPADLFRYKETNAAFPQQTTLDQFFDEAQWESYYHLGRLIAKSLFGTPAPTGAVPPGGWVPATLRPAQ